MRYQLFFYTTFLSIALPLFTSAEPHGPSHRRHSALANRKRTSLEIETFQRRDPNARATFYDVGLGACGITNSPGDFIVALNSCEFGSGFPGPHCFKMITIEYQGKQAQAQITDECPGCPCGGLDMSRGLFTYFAAESVGQFTMNWWYNDGGSPSSSPKPTPTSTWVPPTPTSSSVWVDPSPWTSQTSSSTWSPPPSSSSSSSWTSSSSSSSWNSSSSSSWTSSTWTSNSSTASSTSSSSSSTPTIAPTPSAAENLQNVNKLFAELGAIVVQHV